MKELDYERLLEQKRARYPQLAVAGDFYQEQTLRQRRAFINLDANGAGESVPMHSHLFYEILLCCHGSAEYLLDSRRYRMQAGDVLLIPPGVQHRMMVGEEEGRVYVRYALWVDPDFYETARAQAEMLGYALEQCRRRDNYLLRLAPAARAGIQTTAEALHREAGEQPICWEMCLATGALNLIAQIDRALYYSNTTLPTAENDPLLSSMFSYIDEHLAEKITLDEAARHCLVSRSTVSHIFREKLGLSFYQCVVRRRLNAAQVRILQGVPMGRVCEECGFADYSAFYRLFKKEYGVSPRQFLQMHG